MDCDQNIESFMGWGLDISHELMYIAESFRNLVFDFAIFKVSDVHKKYILLNLTDKFFKDMLSMCLEEIIDGLTVKI